MGATRAEFAVFTRLRTRQCNPDALACRPATSTKQGPWVWHSAWFAAGEVAHEVVFRNPQHLADVLQGPSLSMAGAVTSVLTSSPSSSAVENTMLTDRSRQAVSAECRLLLLLCSGASYFKPLHRQRVAVLRFWIASQPTERKWHLCITGALGRAIGAVCNCSMCNSCSWPRNNARQQQVLGTHLQEWQASYLLTAAPTPSACCQPSSNGKGETCSRRCAAPLRCSRLASYATSAPVCWRHAVTA